MADDEKILRIEAKITEESKKVSDKPTVSSGSGEEVDKAISEVTDRSDVEAIDRQRQQLNDITSIIDSLKTEKKSSSLEDIGTPSILAEEDDPLAKFKITDQIPADAIFGKQEPLTESEQTVATLAAHYFNLLNGANSPPIVPPAPPVASPPVPPTGGAAGAGAIATAAPTVAGAAGGGAVPPVAPPAAGAAGAAGGAALSGLLIDATLLGAAFAGLTAVLLIAEELIDSTFRSMSDEWKNLSGTISAAEAQGEIELTTERLKTESQVAQPVADVTQARADMDRVWIDIKAQLIEVISPLLVSMMEVLQGILLVVNAILAVLKFLLYPTLIAIRVINKLGKAILGFIEWFMGKDREDPDGYIKKIAKFYADSRAVTASTVGPNGNMGYPEPQARK